MKHKESKKQIIQYALKLSQEGYFGPKSSTGGNISALTEDGQAVAVTPSGKHYSRLSPEDICLIDRQGTQLEGLHSPSIETGMHLSIYQNRSDVKAVFHTHQTFASVLSIINQSIPSLFDEVTISLGHIIDMVPYAPPGSRDLEQNVVKKLENGCSCYLLQNHGALTVASSLEEAYHKVELLEKCAQIYYYALTTGIKITTL